MTDVWSTLSDREYDLIVVGGGVFGACAAWEAGRRGLSTLLLERGDFGGATSANTYKFIHGGIRYLARLNIPQLRASSHERSTLLCIAPHLVYPRAVAMPTYGHGAQGKGALRAGFALYDLLTAGRNRQIADAARRIPPAQFLSRAETLAAFPAVPTRGLTGAAVFTDAQVYSPPRLTLAFVRSAQEAGVHAANYAEATGFLRDGARVCGVTVNDVRTRASYAVRSRMVLNAAGPWAVRLLQRGLALDLGAKRPVFSRDVALVTRRQLSGTMGLACPTGTRDANAVVDRGGRHLFFVPWREYMLVGVWHGVHRGDADDVRVPPDELAAHVADANQVYAGLGLRPEDVTLINTGLVLFGAASEAPGSHDFGEGSMLIDHAREHGIDGLVTLVGFRATVARSIAGRVLEPITARLGGTRPRGGTPEAPIHGGAVPDFERLVEEIGARLPEPARGAARGMAHNYGSRFVDVLACADGNLSLLAPLPGTQVLRAEVVHAARNEMAHTLGDVVHRRTDLGTASYPGAAALRASAAIMAGELGWNAARTSSEVAEVEEFFRARGAIRGFARGEPDD